MATGIIKNYGSKGLFYVDAGRPNQTVPLIEWDRLLTGLGAFTSTWQFVHFPQYNGTQTILTGSWQRLTRRRKLLQR